VGCVRVSVDVALVILTCAVLVGLQGAGLKQLNLNAQAQSVCVGVDAQLLLVASTTDIRGRELRFSVFHKSLTSA
jgi:hypothetical protein